MKKKLNKKQEALMHAKGKKMSQMQIMNRKHKAVSNAASNLMGGLYSK